MPDIYLRQGAANPADILLRDPTQADSGGAVTATIAETQAVQSEAIAALVPFAATISESQSAQSESIAAAVRFSATIAETQAVQTESIVATKAHSLSIAESQSAQSEAITGDVTSSGITVAIVEMQAAQVDAIICYLPVAPSSPVISGGSSLTGGTVYFTFPSPKRKRKRTVPVPVTPKEAPAPRFPDITFLPKPKPRKVPAAYVPMPPMPAEVLKAVADVRKKAKQNKEAEELLILG